MSDEMVEIGDPLFNEDGTPWRRVMDAAELDRLIRHADALTPSDVVALVTTVERLQGEVERLRELNRDTRDRLADWHEDNYEVMALVDGATNNEGPSLAIIAAVRAWLDSVPT